MHRPMATAFQQCAEHVLSGPRQIWCFDVDAINDVDAEAQRVLEGIPGDSAQRFFLLNDLYGATPYRVAQLVKRQLRAQGKDVFLVTGASVPMVLKALTDSVGDNFEGYATAIAQTSLRAAIVE